jgi:hypothetical protein
VGGRVFTLAVVIQFFTAGLGIFGAGGFGSHIALGYALVLFGLLLFVAGVVAGRAVATAGLLVVFSLLQIGLVQAGATAPAIAALHPLNALVLLSLGHAVARGLRLPVPGRGAPSAPA